MTKEELNSIILDASSHDRACAERLVNALPRLFEALIQAWQERDNWENDARERQRNTEYYQSLIDEIGGHFGEVAFMRDDGSKSDSILRAKVPELVERLQIRCGVACEERDALKAELGRMKSRPCESEFSRLDGMWQDLVKERDELRTELQSWRDGGLTEEILRRNDGTIKVGRGCRFVYEQYVKDTDAEISALKARVEELEAQHKDCLEQKKELLEKIAVLELMWDGEGRLHE